MKLSSNLDQNLRLDIYLLLRYTEYSRNFLSNCIKKGYVLVNNTPILKSSYKVKPTDTVFFDSETARRAIQDTDFENVMPVDLDINIVFEDEDLLVLNKPSGMATHPSVGHLGNTLLNGVHGYLHHADNAPLPSRKHMVHRLDKDTSGIILFAKTDKMLWWLHRQFAERRVHKYYYALSFAPKKYSQGEQFSLEGFMERSKREKKLYMFSQKYGRWTTTDFTIQETYVLQQDRLKQNLVLISCEPKTGRTHQIRVHLKHLNLPIWGDVLYSSEKQLRIASDFCKSKNIDCRLFLHSYKVEFESYNKKVYRFEIDLPKNLMTLLEQYEKV